MDSEVGCSFTKLGSFAIQETICDALSLLFVCLNPDVDMESEPLEDLPDYEEMVEVAEPRGPHE